MTAQCQLSATSQRQALLISPQSSARKAESRKSFDPELKTEGLMSESSKKGFTLIELMVTIAIIAVLAAVGVIVYSRAQKAGNISKRIGDLKAIQTALELFKVTNGFYPSAGTIGTFVCVDSLTGNNALDPGFMPTVPRDPIQPTESDANTCYKYTSNGIGVTPVATQFKLRTGDTINTEMLPADFAQQPGLIDPDRDGGVVDDNCAIQTTAITAWAIYSSSNTACNW